MSDQRENVAPTPCPACRRGDHGGCWTEDRTRRWDGMPLRCPCAHPSTPVPDTDDVRSAMADAVEEVRNEWRHRNRDTSFRKATPGFPDDLIAALAARGFRVVPDVDGIDGPVTDSPSMVSRLRMWANAIRHHHLSETGRQRAGRLLRDAADVMYMMNDEVVHLRDTVDEQHAELRAAVTDERRDVADTTDGDWPPDPSEVPLTNRLRRYAEVVAREAVSPMVTGRPLAETLVEAADAISALCRQVNGLTGDDERAAT